ncbi:MAG: hypothetical protein ACERLM_06880 [Acidimicrobiales bacterium]
MSAPGYWDSPWPGEDGGPSRQQAPSGAPGLSVQPDQRLEVTRRDIFMGTMVVLRDPGEVFVLQHTFGPDTVSWVERVHPESLETIVRSPDLDAGPFWPGGVVCHANGSLYVTYGTWCHRLDADLTVLASRRLPRDRPYNSLVILPDGSLVMKDFVKDGSAPSTLSVLDPDTLDDRGAPVVMPEPSISRLSADGDTVYALGERTALRYQWDGSAVLALDDDWSAPYVTRPDQSYAWDPVIAGDQVWFMDNGDHTYQGTLVGQGVAAGPLHLVRIPVAGGQPQLVEVSGLPHGTQTNLPLFDPERRIAVAYDSGNGVLAAWHYDDGDGLAPLWRKDLNASMHMIRYPDTGELAVNDHHPDDGDALVVLDIETGDERGRVATGSAEQCVVFPSAGFGRDLYYCSFSTLARISVA